MSSAFALGRNVLGQSAIIARTAISAIIGGVSSMLAGGKFLSGAVSAAFVHLFNAEGASIKRAFESLARGLYRIGDYMGRLSGFRDFQNGSVVLEDYYQRQAISETKAVSTLGKNMLSHPKTTARAISAYNQYNYE
jgi:hypothetical protein